MQLNILITSSGSFNIFGNPALASGPTGGLGLELDSRLNQYFDLGDQSSSCLGDLERCLFGLTFQFNLKVFSLTENMYIFTSGGNLKGNYGVSMWYARKRLYLTVSTKSRIYTVNTRFSYVNKFVRIKFSWSLQSGLGLFFDNRRVVSTIKFIKRTVTVSLTKKFFFGRPIGDGKYTHCIIEGFDFVDAIGDVIDALDLTIGKSLFFFNPFNTKKLPWTILLDLFIVLDQTKVICRDNRGQCVCNKVGLNLMKLGYCRRDDCSHVGL